MTRQMIDRAEAMECCDAIDIAALPSLTLTPVAHAYIVYGECEHIEWGLEYCLPADPALTVLYALDLTPAPVTPDPAAIREAALLEAVEACTYVIQNIDILKADGETYETPRVQKIARGLVDVARQDILALIQKEPTDDRA